MNRLKQFKELGIAWYLRLVWSYGIVLVWAAYPSKWSTRNPPPDWLTGEGYLMYGGPIVLVLALIPWGHYLPRRFTLRTLLIVMTYIAVLLGVAVWAARTI
jgi:hypothetical protein